MSKTKTSKEEEEPQQQKQHQMLTKRHPKLEKFYLQATKTRKVESKKHQKCFLKHRKSPILKRAK